MKEYIEYLTENEEFANNFEIAHQRKCQVCKRFSSVRRKKVIKSSFSDNIKKKVTISHILSNI
jgi:hypothetical protein